MKTENTFENRILRMICGLSYDDRKEVSFLRILQKVMVILGLQVSEEWVWSCNDTIRAVRE